MDTHEILLSIAKRLPTDYTDYGGQVERWQHPEEFYPDCSSGCRHYRRLMSAHEEGVEDADWGVCTNPRSPRAGLLTFEHQAGQGCYES
jgi:hypothetical protein